MGWFFQDVSGLRRDLLREIERYEKAMARGKRKRRTLFKEFSNATHFAFSKFYSPDLAARFTVIHLIRVDNPRRARIFVRNRFAEDFEPHAWVDSVFQIASWPFRVIAKITS